MAARGTAGRAGLEGGTLRNETALPLRQRADALMKNEHVSWMGTAKRLNDLVTEACDALDRAAFVAEHLMQMIDRETWRATGGDDGQGHYEGDYREEQTFAEIQKWKELARV